jgi:hypothetical protein
MVGSGRSAPTRPSMAEVDTNAWPMFRLRQDFFPRSSPPSSPERGRTPSAVFQLPSLKAGYPPAAPLPQSRIRRGAGNGERESSPKTWNSQRILQPAPRGQHRIPVRSCRLTFRADEAFRSGRLDVRCQLRCFRRRPASVPHSLASMPNRWRRGSVEEGVGPVPPRNWGRIRLTLQANSRSPVPPAARSSARNRARWLSCSSRRYGT